MNLAKIKEFIEQKYIHVQKHPTEDLFIYNYTVKAQFEDKWDEEIQACRGLILDSEWNVLYRPLKKFFNYESAEVRGIKIPKTDFKVYEKLDGSLGILYWVNGKPFIATRGSFTSDQAIKGTNMLDKYNSYIKNFNNKSTYLFEIIYPDNRIVVDYGNDERLVLLACINENGSEFDLDMIDYPDKPKILSGVKNYDEIKAKEDNVNEGFVIRYGSGLRLKVKFEEYKRLHFLLTNVTARKVWEILKEGGDTTQYLEKVPDEFYKFFKDKINQIKDGYKEIESNAKEFYNDNYKLSRKELALKLQKHLDKRILPIVFCMVDKKDYSEVIWKLVKPAHEVPFNQIETNE